MGMFDYVKFERPELPDGFDPAHEFQTKDMHCVMATYRISAEGRLLEPLGSDDELLAWHHDEREPTRWRDTHFHGWFNFYTYLSESETGGEAAWHGYHAKFTDGQLMEIKCDDKTEAARERRESV